MAHEHDRCRVLSQSWCQRRPQQQERSEPVPAKISGGHVAGWEWRKGSVVFGVTTICGAHLDHSNPKKYVQLPVYRDAYRDTKRSRAQQKKRCSTNPVQLFNPPYFAVLSAIPKDPERSTSGIANPMFKSSYFTILCAAGGDPKLSKRDAIDPLLERQNVRTYRILRRLGPRATFSGIYCRPTVEWQNTVFYEGW